MEIESTATSHTSAPRDPLPRVKSSNRLRYDAEVQFLIRQNGSLEAIRHRLGLSKRKVCQLLLVDPSAWTRWTGEEKAPPHIYRALDWYLSIMEKDPEYRHLATRFADWIGQEKGYQARLANLELQVQNGLQGSTKNSPKSSLKTMILVFLAGFFLAFLTFRATR